MPETPFRFGTTKHRAKAKDDLASSLWFDACLGSFFVRFLQILFRDQA
jgi:hypothetical protein